MIQHSHNGKGMVYGPNGISPQWKKALWPQWNIALWFIKKAWFYERLFLVVVMVMVKDKKRYSIKNTCQSKLVLCIT